MLVPARLGVAGIGVAHGGGGAGACRRRRGRQSNRPVPAPDVLSEVPVVPEIVAGDLAHYVAASGPGVLAPRGWHCLGLHGSNGNQLVVTPEVHDARDLLAG